MKIIKILLLIVITISSISCKDKVENDEKLFNVFTIGEKLNIYAIDTGKNISIIEHRIQGNNMFSRNVDNIEINYKLSSNKSVVIFPKIDKDNVLLELITGLKSNELNKKKYESARNPLENKEFYIKALTEKYGNPEVINEEDSIEIKNCKVKLYKAGFLDMIFYETKLQLYDINSDDGYSDEINIKDDCNFKKESPSTIYQWETDKMFVGLRITEYKSSDIRNCRSYFKGMIVYQIKENYKERIYERNKKKEIEKAKEGI